MGLARFADHRGRIFGIRRRQRDGLNAVKAVRCAVDDAWRRWAFGRDRRTVSRHGTSEGED